MYQCICITYNVFSYLFCITVQHLMTSNIDATGVVGQDSALYTVGHRSATANIPTQGLVQGSNPKHQRWEVSVLHYTTGPL